MQENSLIKGKGGRGGNSHSWTEHGFDGEHKHHHHHGGD
jgi:hypothetical protein